MSQNPRPEVLAPMRRRYLRAGRTYKARRLDELVELFGCPRKAAVRALRSKPEAARAPCARGRPKEYHPDLLLPPILFPRSRAYQKHDPAHSAQQPFTHVRLGLGTERYDPPGVWPLSDVLCRGALHHLLNDFRPTMKLARKARVGRRRVRTDGPTQTPRARVLAGGAGGAPSLCGAAGGGPSPQGDRGGATVDGALTAAEPGARKTHPKKRERGRPGSGRRTGLLRSQRAGAMGSPPF